MDTTKKEGMMQTLARASPLAPFLFKPDKNPPKVSIRAIIFWGIIVYALQAFLVVCIAALTLNDKIQETAIFKSPADAPVSARGAWNCTPLSSWDTRASWPGSGAAKTYEGAGGAFSAVGEAAMSASECKAKVKEAAFCTTFAEGYVGPTGKCCIWGTCVNGDTELPPCGGLIEQSDEYCGLFTGDEPLFTSCTAEDSLHVPGIDDTTYSDDTCGKVPPVCNLPAPPSNSDWKAPMMGYQNSTAVLDLAKLETTLKDIGTPVPVNDPNGWRSPDPRHADYKTMPFKTINYRLEVGQNSTLVPISTECDKNVWCAQTHPEDLTAEQIHDWQDGKMLVTMGASGIKNVNGPMLALSTCALLPSPELRQVFTTAHEVEIAGCNTIWCHAPPVGGDFGGGDECACYEMQYCPTQPGFGGYPEGDLDGCGPDAWAVCLDGECACREYMTLSPPMPPDSNIPDVSRRLSENKSAPSPSGSAEPPSSIKTTKRSSHEIECKQQVVDPKAFWRSTCGAQKLPYGYGHDDAFVVYQKADPWSPLSFPFAWSASCTRNCTELVAGLEDERMDTCSDKCGTSFRNSAFSEINPKELTTGQFEHSCAAAVDKICDEMGRESGPFQCVRYVSPSYLTIVSAAYSNTMTAMIVLAPALAFLAIKLHGHTAPTEATEVVVDATPTEGKQPDDAFAQRRTL